MRTNRLAFALLVPILLIGAVSAVASEAPLFEVTVSKILMGTMVETTARHPDVSVCRKALYLAYQEMARVEDLLSSHKPDSEVSEINRAAGRHPVRVAAETFSIIGRSKSYARRYDGLFDISIGPLSELWGFSSDGDQQIGVPDSSEIAARSRLVGFRDIELDSTDSSVYLPVEGMAIDLGGVAKGYAIDRGAAVLKQHGVQDFMLNAGGDIYVSGHKGPDVDWRVGVRHPRDPDKLVASFDLRDYAVATSGDYERYRVVDGRRYHHILDPRNGYPGALSESATVVAPTAEEADAAATFLFLLGGRQALAGHRMQAPFMTVTAAGDLCYNDAFAQMADVDQLPSSNTPSEVPSK